METLPWLWNPKRSLVKSQLSTRIDGQWQLEVLLPDESTTALGVPMTLVISSSGSFSNCMRLMQIRIEVSASFPNVNLHLQFTLAVDKPPFEISETGCVDRVHPKTLILCYFTDGESLRYRFELPLCQNLERSRWPFFIISNYILGQQSRP